ncbi:hypothetical protein [Lentzea cavernae]|uniref:Uncharacterized protein n=1 Tax=Lentzea cavernae TaxID=2020703 RepID=A0ABQ3MDP8_9PSEU|nr:hypothetical protein [Lentzea cavernae]GHH37928.1 hypothetical protein GCM10017774_27540 [Lentzea cavernae]
MSVTPDACAPTAEAEERGVARLTADDSRDLALVLARSVTDTGGRISFDDVLAAFGHTRDSLASVEDDESFNS